MLTLSMLLLGLALGVIAALSTKYRLDFGRVPFEGATGFFVVVQRVAPVLGNVTEAPQPAPVEKPKPSRGRPRKPRAEKPAAPVERETDLLPLTLPE